MPTSPDRQSSDGGAAELNQDTIRRIRCLQTSYKWYSVFHNLMNAIEFEHADEPLKDWRTNHEHSFDSTMIYQLTEQLTVGKIRRTGRSDLDPERFGFALVDDDCDVMIMNSTQLVQTQLLIKHLYCEEQKKQVLHW